MVNQFVFKLNRTYCGTLLDRYEFPRDSNGHLNDIYQGGLFLLIFWVYSEIEGLSWTLYHTFILKENHGFNKMTGSLFISDKFKSIILISIFGGFLYYGFMVILQWAGKDFYWYLMGGWILTMLVTINIYPNFIMPLFNNYDPLPEGELRT
jgi:STE24 endopeptidase